MTIFYELLNPSWLNCNPVFMCFDLLWYSNNHRNAPTFVLCIKILVHDIDRRNHQKNCMERYNELLQQGTIGSKLISIFH